MEGDWSSSLDLLVELDRERGGLGRAIEDSLRRAIRAGRLAAGVAVPSTRALAHDLGVARGTVSAAYDQLAAEGYLVTRQGAATRVARLPHRPLAAPAASPSALPPESPGTGSAAPGRGPGPGSGPRPGARPSVPAVVPAGAPAGVGAGEGEGGWPGRPRWDFRPGRPDGAAFPRPAWARACRRVLTHAPDRVFDYGDVRGAAELRAALAGYVGRVRGVDADPARLLVCGGFTQALALVCRVLRARGARVVAVEDPGAARFRRLVAAHGLRPVPVPCDAEGLRVDLVAPAGADAVLVTPAHQYPLGVTMSAARRTALVGWARRHDGLIVEDDYDGEFRYDRRPVGALQPMDPDRVVYAGSASKTLAPGLRLGWLVAPARLAGPLAQDREHLDRGGGILDQLTFAELITSGEFDRQVRRRRNAYRLRRDQLVRALAAAAPDLAPAGISAGLHALIALPGDAAAERRLAGRAAAAGIALATLGEYWLAPPRPRPPAVIVGFGTPPDHAWRPGLAALVRLLAHRP